MRISDWSSDVCSSDLRRRHRIGFSFSHSGRSDLRGATRNNFENQQFAVENLLPFALKRGSLRIDSGSPARTADSFFENMYKAKCNDHPWQATDLTHFARTHLAHLATFVPDVQTLQ